ncbi:MAG: VOC family protein [Acidimicrobiaceae bacterium]|nr:VOC family protein [Acidimicrobiaceae bacterium]
MVQKDSYPHGSFNWVDVCTTDTEVAKSFYSELFGLDFQDDSADEDNIYTIGYKNGLPVLGMMTKTPDMTAGGMPDCWETYISVDDIEKTVAAIPEAGGRLLGPVMNAASGAGRLAVIADPNGAVAILWQPIGSHGACLIKEHGTLSWNELVVNDVDAAMDFYCALLGWSTEPLDDDGLIGIRCGDSGEIIGSATLAPPGVPSHWSVYFAVNDCDATVQHVLRLGGQVIVPASTQRSGRTAQVADNQGAMFWITTCES